MIGRVFRESGEVLRVICRAVLILPDMRVVEEVVAEHIQHRNHADRRAEQIWPLRQSGTYEQTRVGAPKYGEPSGSSSSCVEEPFGRAQEVVVGPLPIASLCSVVPFDSKLRSATNVGQGKQASTLHKKGNKDAELRRHRNTVTAIRSHNCWITTSYQHVLAANEEHRDSCAVFGPQPGLGMAESCGIKRDGSFFPEHAPGDSRGVTENADGRREGFGFKKQFVAIR